MAVGAPSRSGHAPPAQATAELCGNCSSPSMRRQPRSSASGEPSAALGPNPSLRRRSSSTPARSPPPPPLRAAPHAEGAPPLLREILFRARRRSRANLRHHFFAWAGGLASALPGGCIPSACTGGLSSDWAPPRTGGNFDRSVLPGDEAQLELPTPRQSGPDRAVFRVGKIETKPAMDPAMGIATMEAMAKKTRLAADAASAAAGRPGRRGRVGGAVLGARQEARRPRGEGGRRWRRGRRRCPQIRRISSRSPSPASRPSKTELENTKKLLETSVGQPE